MEGHGKFQGRVGRGAEKLEGIIRQRRNILREVAGGGFLSENSSMGVVWLFP